MFARARRLLLIPAIGLVLLGAPAFALDRPSLPAPSTEEVPLVVPLDNAGPGWRGEADVPANLVGIKWSGDPDAEFKIEIQRADEGRRWVEAGTLGGEDVGADDGTSDASSAVRALGDENASEPLWVGDARDVRVTVVSGAVDAVSVEAVTSDRASAPNGSVGALGVSFPDGPDRFGYAIALVLAGVVLGAVAAGWSPWRSRRQLALIGVLGVVVLTACGPPPSPNAVNAGQPAMTMRSQWGPDLAWNPSPDCSPGPEYADFFSFVVVHHTVNSNTYGPNDSQAMVRAIQQYHVKTLGYCDIAYNFLVDKYGQIFEGRQGGITKSVIAAHAGGFNTGSSGMAFIGNYTNDQPPPAAWNSMVNLIAWKLSVHYLDPSAGFTAVSRGGGSRWPEGTSVSFPNKIVGHRDLWATACPGDAFYPRLPALRTAVQPQVGWDPNAPPTTTSVPSSTSTTSTTSTTRP